MQVPTESQKQVSEDVRHAVHAAMSVLPATVARGYVKMHGASSLRSKPSDAKTNHETKPNNLTVIDATSSSSDIGLAACKTLSGCNILGYFYAMSTINKGTLGSCGESFRLL